MKFLAVFSIEPQDGCRRLLAEAEEGQAGLGDDRGGDGQRRLHDDRRQHVRQDVAQDDPAVGQADRPRALDVVLGLHRQHLAAGQADEDRHRREADRDHRIGQARAEEGRERDREDQERAGQQRLGDARDHGVEPAAVIAGDEAERHADDAPRSRPRRRPPSARRGRRRSGARGRRGRARRCRASARPRAPCGPPGSWSAIGSYGATSGASTASSDEERARRRRRRRRSRLRRNFAPARGSRGRGAAVPASVGRRSRHRRAPQPRVDQDVEDVGEQVHEDEADRRAQHDALHHRVVAVEDRIDDQLAEARDGEDLLGQHRAGEQLAEQQRRRA